MDDRTAFKLNFLLKCAQDGLSPAEALQRASTELAALEKRAGLPSLTDLAKVPLVLGAGGLGLSAGAGAMIGHHLAESSEPEFDPEDIKRQELAQALRQEADRARRNTAMIQRQRMAPRPKRFNTY